MTIDKRLVYPENGSRNLEYQEKLHRIHVAGVCPFCPEHMNELVGKVHIVYQTKHWTVAKNNPPYKGSIAHMLVICRLHITKSTELSDEARLEYFKVVDRIAEENKLEHYSIIMRNGGPGTGATVAHLHFHVVSAGTEPIMVRI